MKVLVTGGTGYLGRAVVQALAVSGHDVVLYARTATASGLPAAAIDGDIRDRDRLDAAARGCDAILHSAALVATWVRRRRDFDDINVGGLAAVLEAASRHGIRRIVYTSSFLALAPAGLGAPPKWNDYQRKPPGCMHVPQKIRRFLLLRVRQGTGRDPAPLRPRAPVPLKKLFYP